MALKDWLKTTLTDPAGKCDRYAQWFIGKNFPDDATQLPRLTLADDERTIIENALEQLSNPNPQRVKEIKLIEARNDLVARFVAVAISVGFASSLSKMLWLIFGRVPYPWEWEGLLRLLTALFVAITGWEWFHRDVDPNRDVDLGTVKSWLRFLLDISVVVVSLILLLSFQTERLWLYSLAMIFLLYVLWDILSGRNEAKKVNSVWSAYFIILIVITIRFPLHERDIAIMECLFVTLGVLVLWLQGHRLWRWHLVAAAITVVIYLPFRMAVRYWLYQ
jgi:hypothetical protein